MKTKQLILKPNKIEAHLRYTCANHECRLDHWLSLQESQTSNFKIVCECGAVYRPKKVKKLKLLYKSKCTTSTDKDLKTNHQTQATIPEDLLSRTIKTLTNYGFTHEESESLILRAYAQNPTSDIGLLIKHSLSIFGGSNG